MRIGFLGVAHMHAYGYAPGLLGQPNVQLSGVWDHDLSRAQEFARRFESPIFSSAEEGVENSDAIIITSENNRHIDLLELATNQDKPALCEKPIIGRHEDRLRLLKLASAPIMTAFPCRYSPAYRRLKARVQGGDLGVIRAICATNRGRCPFGWFTNIAESGGGAMIDHVVHVADLLRDMLQEEVTQVTAMTGNNMYGQTWEDTAMLTLEFSSGKFATLDSSWSRPASYKTWGDVTMNVVGEFGVAEVDLFGQQFEVFGTSSPTCQVAGYGSDIDSGLVADFLKVVRGEIEPPISLHDGLAAVDIAFAGYESAKSGQSAPVRGLTLA